MRYSSQPLSVELVQARKAAKLQKVQFTSGFLLLVVTIGMKHLSHVACACCPLSAVLSGIEQPHACP